MSVSILVVDDEPDVADLFRQRFRRESRQGKYIMHFAASGAEALDRLAEEIQPALVAVLSDINMPGMDGLNCSAASGSTQSRAASFFRQARPAERFDIKCAQCQRVISCRISAETLDRHLGNLLAQPIKPNASVLMTTEQFAKDNLYA
jgi:CheY-like chemotaxis protein